MYSRLEDQEPKGLGALCYVIFLGTFEWGMVIPTLWPLLQRMGSPEMYFGLVIGTFSLTRVICQPIIGALGDRWDFQVLLCSCLLCSALGGVLYALSPVPWLLLVSRIICGVGASCTPLLFAWTARAYSGVQEVAAAQVRLNTMRSLGTFIGPFGSTLLCVLPKEGLFNELNSAGWAIAAANLFGVVLCCYRLTDPAVPSEPRVSAAERGQHGQPPVTAARSFPTTPVIWTCLLFQVTTALLLAVLEVVPPIVLTDEFRLPPAATSILFGIASLAVIALFALVEVLSRKVSGRSLMTAGVLLVSCGALWAQTSWKLGSSFLDFVLPWLVLAVAPAPLLRTPARTLYTSHLPKHVQGTMQGISEAAFSFANFVGPILGSHVATSGGFEGLRLTMLGLVVAEVLLLCVGFSRLVPGTEL